jgi:hypothetical protein
MELYSSGVPGYGDWGLTGHKSRSITQTESKPSLSASFAILAFDIDNISGFNCDIHFIAIKKII